MDYKAVRRRHRRGNETVARESRRSRARRSRPACSRRSARSAGCSASTLGATASRCSSSSADGVGTKLKIAFIDRTATTPSARTSSTTASTTSSCRARGRCSSSTTWRPGGCRRTWPSRSSTGIARGCRENGCALIGGETAEMPGFYARRRVRPRRLHRRRRRPREGHRRASASRRATSLIGLPSAGLHTNGYSLARKIVFDALRAAASTDRRARARR